MIRSSVREPAELTWNQGTVYERVHRPEIWCPVRMAQSPRERKKPIFQLKKLIGKWPKSNCEDTHYADPEFNNIQESRAKNVLRIQAVGAEEVDEVGQREVKVDMLEAKQSSKQEPTGEKLLASQNKRENQDAVHESVVLEVDMVDDEEARREEDRQAGNMSRLFIRKRSRLDESESSIRN